jgi:predicted RND superfamily exporter protein
LYKNLEERMRRLGLWIANHPLKVILLSSVLLLPLLVHIPQIKFDTSNEGFFHKDDPILISYNKFREQFGRDERIAVAIKSDKIFTLDFFKTLKALHEEIENNVPYLDDVTSLYNVRNTRGRGDELLTDDLMEPFPTTQAEVDAIKKRAMASHFYRDLFISRDGKMTAIIIETDAYSHKNDKNDDATAGFDDTSADDIAKDSATEDDTQASLEDVADTDSSGREFLTDQENGEIVKAVLAIAQKYRDKGLEIYVAGSPIVLDILKQQMKSDMQKFTRITILIVMVFLFLMFRRISAVFYPLIVVVLALLATVGLMAWTGTSFKLPTQIVPSLLLAVSVGATVHVLSIFFDRFNETSDKKEAIAHTLGHSGLAIAMTSVTTAIGVGSFAGSEVAPISDLGIFASFGVMVSLLLTLTLLPALLAITKLKPKAKRQKGRFDHLMAALAQIPVRHYKQILVASVLLMALALWQASTIELSHNPLHWFKPDKPARVATEVIDKHLNGSLTVDTVIDTGKENGWVDPDRLARLDSLTDRLEKYRDAYTHIGKAVSLNTIVKETNRALHANNEAYYTIPKDQKLVAQELLLFENSGSDDLEDVVDSQFSKARLTVKLPWVDSIKATGLLQYITDETRKTFPDANVTVTGVVPLMVTTFSQAIHSAVISYLIAFVLIMLMMMLILRSVCLGALAMIPNLTPIILGLLLMVVFDIPLDMFTLLIGSIAIGLAVDDTIHFMHNFMRYYHQSKDSTEAIRHTFFTTGKAMVITSIVLSLGFYAYMMAEMTSVQNFGFLTGTVILVALLADLLMAPALMIVAAKRGWIK